MAGRKAFLLLFILQIRFNLQREVRLGGRWRGGWKGGGGVGERDHNPINL